MKNREAMTPIVGITADDLTGAADTAAAFARAGAAVPVSLNAFPPARRGASAFAITTETRARAADDVAGIVSASVRDLGEAGATLIYKKIDSNLRGNVGRELGAVRDAVEGPLLLAPAFPVRGRTTRGGVVFVDGVPVADTEMGRDPQAPARHSDLAALLRSQRPDLEVRLCPLAMVRQGAAAVRELLGGSGIVVADAETDADLDVLAEAALDRGEQGSRRGAPLQAVAGCAGFAAALARRLFGEPTRRSGLRADARSGHPVLGVLASTSALLPRQAAQAAAQGCVTIAFSCANLSDEEGELPELGEVIDRAIAELASGRSALIYSAGTAGSRRVSSRYDPARWVELVVEHLAHAAFVAVRRAWPKGLLVGGGTTAQGVLAALGANAIDVDDEPLAGIAAGVIAGGEMDERPVVLKPGAAGGVEAVGELMRYLEARA